MKHKGIYITPTLIFWIVFSIAGYAANPQMEIATKHASLGGSGGILGLPVSPYAVAPDGIGHYRHYRNGSIYWSPSTGAHEVHGLIREKWASLGWERGFLGYPLTDESRTPDGVGRYNHFQKGSIYWTPATGAHEVHGLIREKWASLGWERSVLGYPLTDESKTPDGVGRYTHFQKGSIYWTPATGAHEVHGLIREKWASLGWERGWLGYPLSDETQAPGFSGYGRYSKFQGGLIYYYPDSGAIATTDLAGVICDTPRLKPNLGTRKLLAIIWDPRDPTRARPNEPTTDQIDRLLFGSDPSVRDWYLENSGGRFRLERAGLLRYDALKPADHYWDNQNTDDGLTDNDSPHYHQEKYNDGWLSGHVEKWTEAIRQAGRDFNFAAHDLNKDGQLSSDKLAVLIIIPADNPFGAVRPVRGRQVPDENLIVDNVRIADIAEWYTGSPGNLGAPAHELSHLFLGSPYLYLDGKWWPFAAQAFSLMDSSYSTAHLDPFTKLKAGWLNYTVAAGSGEYLLRSVEESAEGLILFDPRRVTDPRRGPGEYFIVENRFRGVGLAKPSYDAGRDSTGAGGGLPNDGLAIWHIIEDPNLLKLSTPPGVPEGDWGRRAIRLVRADGGVPSGQRCTQKGLALVCVPLPADDAKALFGTPGDFISDQAARARNNASPARLRWADGSATGFEVRLVAGPGEQARVAVTINR